LLLSCSLTLKKTKEGIQGSGKRVFASLASFPCLVLPLSYQ
jgi:hypothetical protein